MSLKHGLIGIVGVSTLAPWGIFALEPDELFRRASRSIVAIHGFDTRVKPFTYGSGVVIAPETVITNCHVLAKTRAILVMRGNASYKATLQHPDVERDLCQLSVPDLNAPAVTLGNSTSIQIGQRAFAIGNPIGLELTLSDGLISGFRKMQGSDVPRIQTSAPASPGSSGGGLFDRDGNLIGITTLIGRDAQNITIAHPVEWVREVPERAKVALARRAETATAATGTATAGSYPRQLAGEELVAHMKLARNIDVEQPNDLLSLAFRPGNRVDMVVRSRHSPSGEPLSPGTFSVNTDQNLVCLNPGWGNDFNMTTSWPPDCFRVSQTGEKTYAMTSPKTGFTIRYSVR